MKDIKKRVLTLQDLEDAVKVINDFARMYRKAQMAVKDLAREQSRQSGVLGRGADPITSMLFGSMEGMVEKKMEEMADKRVRQMLKIPDETVDVDEDDLAEAREGLDEED